MAASHATPPPRRLSPTVGRRRLIREALDDRGWRRVTFWVVLYVVLGAVFPRVRHGGWFARLGTRGRLVYVALTTLSGFATRELVRRARASHERVVAEVRELGLEPTDEEVRCHYVRRYLREDVGREPTDQEAQRHDRAVPRLERGRPADAAGAGCVCGHAFVTTARAFHERLLDAAESIPPRANDSSGSIPMAATTTRARVGARRPRAPRLPARRDPALARRPRRCVYGLDRGDPITDPSTAMEAVELARDIAATAEPTPGTEDVVIAARLAEAVAHAAARGDNAATGRAAADSSLAPLPATSTSSAKRRSCSTRAR